MNLRNKTDCERIVILGVFDPFWNDIRICSYVLLAKWSESFKYTSVVCIRKLLSASVSEFAFYADERTFIFLLHIFFYCVFFF